MTRPFVLSTATRPSPIAHQARARADAGAGGRRAVAPRRDRGGEQGRRIDQGRRPGRRRPPQGNGGGCREAVPRPRAGRGVSDAGGRFVLSPVGVVYHHVRCALIFADR